MAPGARAIRAAPAVLAVGGVAGLAAILEPNAYPSYDYAFTLASAQDILAGRATGYQVPVFSPVPHPLTLGQALALAPLGDAAFPLFTAVALLALGVLCWSLFAIGRTLAAWPVGLLAAGLVFTSPAIFELATRTYGDVVFAALVAAAIALEVARPRRGWPVAVLLALAGLVRPEAWLLSGLYWLYLFPRRARRQRLALGLLVLVGPGVWMAMDSALTGDPFHSFNVTRIYTDKADASVSAQSLWTAMRTLTGWPVLAAAAAGALLAWRRNRVAAATVVIVGVLAFVETVGPAVLGESPVLRRYLLVPAVVLSLLFAVACLGWSASNPYSRVWRAAGGAFLLVAVVLLAPGRVDLWSGHRHAQAKRVELLEHLQRWAASPGPSAYLTAPACRPVLVPGYGYRPYLRFWLDVPPRAVAFHFGDATPSRGIVLLPTAADSYQRLMLSDVGRRTRRNVLRSREFRARFDRVARSAQWELFAEPGCRRAVR